VKLSLHSFEEMIPEKIIDRGFNYYEQGQVARLKKTGEYEFSANVWGRGDSYTVYILLDETQNIVEHHCDCPYDWGDHCKHLVAVLYYLYDSEMYTVEQPADEGIQELKHHLEAYNKEELIELFMELSNRNYNLQRMLFDEFGIEYDDQV